MKTSVEVSYYPLHEDYVDPIRDFIKRMNLHEGLVCKTNGMSTQIFGEYDAIMDALKQEIRKSFDLPRSVFVLKIINSDLDTKE
jgi:uncharacterized protein YqgV (UPF0045/DUF77 family)